MGEDADDSGRLLNDCDQLQLSITIRALLDVDIAISIDRFNSCTRTVAQDAYGAYAVFAVCVSSNEDKHWRALPVSLTTYDHLVIFALAGNGSSQKRGAPYVKH